jgi:prepilin peptidase CpaA
VTIALSALIHSAVLAGFVALLIWAAASDIRAFLIPNRLCLAIAALWPAFVLTDPAPAWAAAALTALATLAVGLALFSARLMGGGDVKLMAAVALWAGPQSMLAFVLVTSVVGGLLSLFMLAASRFQWAAARPDGTERRSFFRIHVPYGAAIAAGGLFVAARFAAG